MLRLMSKWNKIPLNCNFKFTIRNFGSVISEWNNSYVLRNSAEKLVLQRKYCSKRDLQRETFTAISQTTRLISDAEKSEFIAVFSDVVNDLTSESSEEGIIDADQHFARALQHTVPNGKLNAAFAAIATCNALVSSENLTAENRRLKHILAWCTELLGAFLYISDDIIDSSLYRRGGPCWYRHEGVGLQAINDAVMVTTGSYLILKKYFSRLPCYVPLLELFTNIALNTTKGQTLDTMSVIRGKSSLDFFTIARHNALGNNRFNYTFFRLPVIAAIHFSNKCEPNLLEQVETILYLLGNFCQVQNDILDNYGNPTAYGKEGSDIQEGKCSWLIVQALLRATPSQQQVLKENYGKHNTQCIEVVRSLYDELDLLNVYANYKTQINNEINSNIEKLSNERLKNVFFVMAEQYLSEECFMT